MSEDINRRFKSGKKIAFVFIALGLIVGGAVGMAQEPLPGAASGWTLSDGLGGNQYHITIADVNDDGVNDYFYWSNADPREEDDDPNSRFVANQSQVNIIDGKTGEILATKNLADYPWVVEWYPDHWMFRTSTNQVILVASIGNHSKEECTDCSDGYNSRFQWDKNQTFLLRFSIDLTRAANQEIRLEQTANFTKEGWDYLATPEDGDQPQTWYLRNWEGMLIPGTGYRGDVLVIKSARDVPGSNYQCSASRTISFVNPENLETLSQMDWRLYGPANYSTWGNAEECNSTEWGFASGPLGELEQTWDYPYFYAVIEDRLGDGLSYSPWECHFRLTTLEKLKPNMSETNDWILDNTLGVTDRAKLKESNFRIFLRTKVILSLNASGKPSGVTCFQSMTYNIQEFLPASYKLPDEGDSALRKFWYENFPTFEIDHDSDSYHIVLFSAINSFNIPSNSLTFRSRQTNGYYKTEIEEIASPFGAENLSQNGMPISIFPVRTQAGTNQSSIAVLHSDQKPSDTIINGRRYPLVDGAITFLPQAYAGTITNTTYLDLNDVGATLFTSTNSYHAVSRYDFYDYYQINKDFDVDGDGLTDIPFLGTTNNESQLDRDTDQGVLNGPFFTVTQQNYVNQTLFFSLSSNWEFQFSLWATDANNDTISDAYIGGSFMFFSLGYPEPQLGPFEARLADPATQMLFIFGIVMIGAGLVVLILAFLLMRDASLKIAIHEKIRAIIMVFIVVIALGILFSQLENLTNSVTQEGGTQVGVTAEASAIANLSLTSGVAWFFLFFGIFFAAGLYMLVTPKVSDGIVSLNQIFFAKTAGLKATMKKRAMTKEEVEKSAGIRYKIVIVPPFGRKITSKMLFSRVLSVMALAIAIGLNVFEYGTLLYDAYGVRNITTITGLTDTNFIGYISSLFIYLIIPGIIAVPLFFWLVPTSWLLNDAGVLFYKRKIKAMDPEDIEPIGGWFSNYLKGFLGIGALVSYVKFILQSPITASIDNFSTDIQFPVLFFVFGFIIIAGLSIGIVVVLMHGITLPYNAGRLYTHLKEREVDIKRKKIHWDEYEELTIEATEKGFLEVYKKPSDASSKEPKDAKKGKAGKKEKKEKKAKKSKEQSETGEAESILGDQPDRSEGSPSMPPGGDNPPGDASSPGFPPADDFPPRD